MSKPIESYALIGDGESAALVGRDGSIDWLCWPRFDDEACLCAILGTEEHGHWLLAPEAAAIETVRRYRGESLILETDIRTGDGVVRITDFMPVRDGSPALVRIIQGLAGTVRINHELRLRFGYGQVPPWCEPREDGMAAVVGPDRVRFRSSVPIRIENARALATFDLREGDRHTFVLSHGTSTSGDPAGFETDAALSATQQRWESWIARFDSSRTLCPTAVKRSLLTLKALVHQRTGGLVAAPTTSLPEAPAGGMNWDYRFCWLRDATFTLSAFLNAGFEGEARAWRDWLLRAVAGAPDKMRIMYRVDGARHLEEWTVDALPGYRGARPVRAGNAASSQHQIDVYGEVLDCLDLARQVGIEVTDH